jgi:adenosylcobinamide-GDP ribazoletransferase
VTWLLVATVLSLLAVWRGDRWWLGLATAAVVVLAVGLLVRRCVRRFGGVTGDVMGASVEVALTVLVVVAAR